MTATLAALLFAHVLADFVFQTDHMVANKKKPATLALHTVIVLLTAQAALGRVDAWEPLALAAAHILIDVVKVHALPDRLSAFFADQTAHLVTILALAGGFILATFAGAHVLRLLVQRWEDENVTLPTGLPHGGRLIGLLERGIIYMLVLTGNPAGVGFLIAAKSVLRFETARDDQRAGEYVIIGTLASFGWALAVSWATVALLSQLPPLGFLVVQP